MITLEMSLQDATTFISEKVSNSLDKDVVVLIRPTITPEGFKSYDLNILFTPDAWSALIKGQVSNKIKWIKIVRALSGMSLCDAKQFVEKYL